MTTQHSIMNKLDEMLDKNMIWQCVGNRNMLINMVI